ncbi:MAG: uncharacterized protein KVP18_003518 [Porospora cf. gigantea A]|uniref:uncharacterized protein n=1 Tax=Porospora cf. gigantea A TaxID=2853593 RepID=UPI003559B03D|nr:MAG: hypothetical protein KVP18_003518 [Porospora cf. gigantea A]
MDKYHEKTVKANLARGKRGGLGEVKGSKKIYAEQSRKGMPNNALYWNFVKGPVIDDEGSTEVTVEYAESSSRKRQRPEEEKPPRKEKAPKRSKVRSCEVLEVALKGPGAFGKVFEAATGHSSGVFVKVEGRSRAFDGKTVVLNGCSQGSSLSLVIRDVDMRIRSIKVKPAEWQLHRKDEVVCHFVGH